MVHNTSRPYHYLDCILVACPCQVYNPSNEGRISRLLVQLGIQNCGVWKQCCNRMILSVNFCFLEFFKSLTHRLKGHIWDWTRLRSMASSQAALPFLAPLSMRRFALGRSTYESMKMLKPNMLTVTDFVSTETNPKSY